MLGLANICGAVCSFRSQETTLKGGGWEGGEMADGNECNYVQVSQLFLSKIVGLRMQLPAQ